MANMHSVSPERFRFISHRIKIATKIQDWRALRRCDAELNELLTTCQQFLSDPQIAPHVTEVKAAHKAAYDALRLATSELESQMSTVNDQQERAVAYQATMSAEG
ncbi:LafD [Vibrio ziniensis]|uniref:LafD n=1 Tax=Vibrio ziniensis TaxID=2711221 RepID=A0A6G7CML9_9VIBR|nr:LafD [Vibrio ziniensis]QIH43352.1 LafD [Vibrio ziniensis]